jgi:aminoglycoside phosphotransferase (APT) family kinase protein
MTTSERQSAFSGTREVAERLRFDVARLENYLSANVPGFAGPVLVSQFKGGQSNPTYLVDTPLRRYVLRRKPPGKLLPSAHAVDREHRVISALYAQGFPVAEPLLFCADESIVGTAFFLMAFAEGRVFWEPHMPDSYPAERAQVYDGMNTTLARLHAFDPAAIGLGDYGRGEQYVARQVQWHMPHSDAGTGSLVGFDLGAFGIPSLDAYIDLYVARTGLDPRPHLPVYFAYNFFRLAAILQGIAGRVRDGTATSALAAGKAQAVRPLAAKAFEFASQAGA